MTIFIRSIFGILAGFGRNWKGVATVFGLVPMLFNFNDATNDEGHNKIFFYSLIFYGIYTITKKNQSWRRKSW